MTNTTTTTCNGHTKSGSRCRRRAQSGQRFCAQHAHQDPSPPPVTTPEDIDRSALDRAIADLGGNADPFTVGSSSGYGTTGDEDVATHALDELRQVADMIGENVGRIRDVAVGAGLVEANAGERFLIDLAAAASGVAQAIAERLAGDYEEDDFGFDERFTNQLLPLATLLYRYWWRVDVEGIENVPAEGRGLLVSNHAGGGIPFDGAMIKAATMLEHPQQRHVRVMVLDWLMGLPWLADFMKQTGQALACAPNAVDLLRRDYLVAVFPEGVKGMGKPFSQRYNLQRFGRGGFVRIALRTGSPIVPVAVVGSEEIYPKIANMPMVNRLIGAPFVPVTPLFPLFGLAGLVPLPSKWHIEFCEPIDVSQYGPDAVDDRALVLEISQRVRATIQERLRQNLLKRRTPFW